MLVIGFLGGGPTALGDRGGARRAGRHGGRDPRASGRLPLPHDPARRGRIHPRRRPALLCRGPDPRGRLASAPSPSSLAFLALRRAFQRASGGLSFKIGGPLPLLTSSAERTALLLPASAEASSARCLAVSVPSRLFSVRATPSRNLRARVRPQRRWLVEQLGEGHALRLPGALADDLEALVSPRAIERFSSARARRTRLARASACMCCGPSMTEALLVAGAIETASTWTPPSGSLTGYIRSLARRRLGRAR